MLRRICECDPDGAAADYLVGLGCPAAVVGLLNRAVTTVDSESAMAPSGAASVAEAATALLAELAECYASVESVTNAAYVPVTLSIVRLCRLRRWCGSSDA